MRNPRLAGRYAKSLLDLANEKGQLEKVYKDMLYLKELLKQSKDLSAVLKSPVIKADKKEKILGSVFKGRVSETTTLFSRLLVQKAREFYLQEIVDSFISQYKQLKGIQIVKLTTAVPVSEELKKLVVQKIKAETKIQNIELNTEVKPEVIGGFRLEVGDNLVDATIQYDLSKVKAQFLNNDFIYRIR